MVSHQPAVEQLEVDWNGFASADAFAAAIPRPEAGLDSIAKAAADVLGMALGGVALAHDRRLLLLAECSRTPDYAAVLHTEAVSMLADGCLTGPIVMEDSLPDRCGDGRASCPGTTIARFYAGIPLPGRQGPSLGILYVLDVVPRTLDADQVRFLSGLALAAATVLDRYGYRKVELDHHRGERGRDGGDPITWTCGRDGGIVVMDASFIPLADLDAIGVVPIDWVTIAHPTHRGRIRARWAEAVRTGMPLDAEFRINDQAGSAAWVRARLTRSKGNIAAPDLWSGTLVKVGVDQGEANRSASLLLHDPLTGLLNRSGLQAYLSQATEGAGSGRPFAVFCLDLDDFKLINDALGHQAGDTLLQAVSQRLQACTRQEDIVARLGGDEFVIIQVGVNRPSDVEHLALRLTRDVGAPIQLDGTTRVVNVSIGISLCPRDGDQAELLLRNADMALYRAKHEGRGLFRFFKPTMDLATTNRRTLQFDLHHAIDRDELALVFQPIISIAGSDVTSVEALLRWRHPKQGLISPAEFIPIAESSGLIRPIGAWVLRQACVAGTGWPAPLRVSVNLSPMQFELDDIFGIVAQTLRETQFPAERLDLEITETLPLLTNKRNLLALERLRRLGVRLVLDDFGTGYSSLSYLRAFHFDKIKLDRAFIQSMSEGDGLAIGRAIIKLAHELRIEVTAEGIETTAQLEQARREGCDEVQGYLFGRPVSPTKIPALIRSIGGKHS